MKKTKKSLLQNLFSNNNDVHDKIEIKEENENPVKEIISEESESDEKEKEKETYEDMVKRIEIEEEEKEEEIEEEEKEEIKKEKKKFLSKEEVKKMEEEIDRLEKKNKKELPFLFKKNQNEKNNEKESKKEIKEINQKISKEIKENLKDIDLSDLGFNFIEWSSSGIEYFINNSKIFGETNLKGFQEGVKRDEKIFKTLIGLAMKDKGSSLYKILNWCGTKPTKMILLLYIKNLAQSIYVNDKNVYKQAKKLLD